ncbi:V-snare-domain-containing protein [Auriculariales sp. MPI-PUGE-AT-0066]|nr:V-snare-domain-containing protein [Auriculariales sp. MPI-PUGE-AT-0066]
MDNATLFQSYESDLKQILASAQAKLDGEAKEAKGEARKAALRRVDMELDEADEMVSQMEVEIHGMPQSIKGQFLTRARNAKTDLNRLKALSRDLANSGAREALLGGRSGPAADDPYGSGDARTRLLQGNSQLADGTRRLQDSQRIALETEDIGADILRNLGSQREQIEHARDTLRQADGSIDRASGTLKSMIRRMYQQRVITGLIVGVLIIVILVILYEKIFA